jgi:hypothetical protein
MAKFYGTLDNNDWVHQIAMNPDHAIELLKQHTLLNNHEITVLFQQFFIHGYQSAMWFLAAVSFIALLIMIFGTKKTNHAS